MSEAKAMKMREYGTDVISHELCYANNAEVSNNRTIRTSNTFKSRVLDTASGEPDQAYRIGLKTATYVHALSKERLFTEKPLYAKI